MGSGQVLGQVTSASASYVLLLTSDPGQVRAAHELRQRVFGEEFGLDRGAAAALDVDRFDDHCDHLVVQERGSGEIVGTYRLLRPEAARAAGGLYAETEFDCAGLAALRPGLVETGRSCVAPGHRSGGVIGMIWAGLLRYLLDSGHGWMVGCASVPLDDGGGLAAGVERYVTRRHLAPDRYRVRPHRPLAAPPPNTRALPPPPLLRGYLRLGAWVCGPPAHDPDFGCADFLVLLEVDRMDPRYLRHFLGGAG